MRLKFGKSANKSGGRRFGEFIQNYKYIYMDIRLACAIGKAQFAKFAKLHFYHLQYCTVAYSAHKV